MASKETFVRLAQGAVGGIAIAAAVALGAGWVTTAGARDAQVRTAAIEAETAICATLVRSYHLDSGESQSLAGYAAREARQQLAAAHAVTLAGAESPDPAVVSACARMLDRADI